MEATARTDALRRVAEALNGTLNPEAAIGAMLPELEHVLGLKTAWAFRFDPHRKSFSRAGATGLPRALSDNDQEELRWPGCECQKLFLQGKLRRAVNMVRCSRLAGASGDKAGLVVHASVPLRSKGEMLGIMNVAAPGKASFGGEALSLLSAVGNQVAVALDRCALYAEEQHRSKQLAALADIARELTALTDPSRLLKAACRLGCERFGMERLAFVEEDGERLLVRTGWGEDGEIFPHVRANHGYPVLAGSKGWAAAPTGRGLVLVAESTREEAFGSTDAVLLEAYAAHVATAHENATRQAALREAAVLAERQRIAADLHDAVSQRLFSALLASRAATLTLSADPVKARRALHHVETEVKTAQGEMSQLVRTLRPPGVTQIVPALDRLLKPLRETGEIRLRSYIQRQLVPLGPDVQTSILRIAEEAIHNALRHARAKTVTVSWTVGQQAVRLKVADDGTGFDPKQVALGQGLRGMEERTRSIGGTFRLKTEKGGGTSWTLTVPIKGGSEDG